MAMVSDLGFSDFRSNSSRFNIKKLVMEKDSKERPLDENIKTQAAKMIAQRGLSKVWYCLKTAQWFTTEKSATGYEKTSKNKLILIEK
ncbi:hypothetical protein FACS1894162_3640 [Bacteroidia bacterium]|nr:hypothetical protein FACS1894162_3640 [Bacteroidia bacterium]